MLFRRSWKSLGASTLLMILIGILVTACQAAAAPTASSTTAATTSTTKLILSSDMVQGTKNLTKDMQATNGCILTSRFPRNSEIVWRARVYDPRTGELMNKTQLSKVEVQLANGKTIAMQYGSHPKNPPGEAYWTGSWVVPKDAPTGTLNYTIVATSTDGRTGEYKPYSVQSSLLTITDQTLPDLAQASQ